MSSSGRYTHTDGKGHRRVPLGCYKIGQFASWDEHKITIDDVQDDPRIHDREWARRLGLVSFAAYQLRALGGKTLGVLALFARRVLPPDELAMIDGLSSTTALVVQQAAAVEELHKSEERFRRITVNMRDLVAEIDTSGIMVYVSPSNQVVLGYRPEEMVGQSCFALVHPEDRDRVQETFRAAMSTGTSAHAEFRARHADGHYLWLESLGTLLRDHDGQKNGVILVSRDVTERKRSEESLRTSRQIMEGIMNSLPVRVFWKDKNLIYLGGNAAFVRDAGFGDPKDLIGKDDYQMGWREQAELYRGDDRQVMESGCPKLLIEEPQTTPDGDTITLLSSKVPLRNSTGEITGLLGTYLDITERKLAEEKAKQLMEELDRSNKELEQFAYIASHDLQEPLRMVSSYTQLLARRYQGRLDANADEFIAFAVDGANRMQRLINDLLAYSRVCSRGKEFETTDCTAVFDQALANLKAAIDESGALVIRGPLPTVMADKLQIGQLLQNLIGNAIKYHGAQPGQVHVSAEQKGDEWVFSVRDNGIGIDPQYADRIFVIFQRLHTIQIPTT